MQGQYVSKNYYTYVQRIASIASAASANGAFNVDGDSDFYWTKLCVYALDGSNGTTVLEQLLAGVTLLLRNETSGRAYSSAAVPLAMIAGDGRLPFILPMETFWPAKATISYDLANITDDTTYAPFYLAFIGYKAFLA